MTRLNMLLMLLNFFQCTDKINSVSRFLRVRALKKWKGILFLFELNGIWLYLKKVKLFGSKHRVVGFHINQNYVYNHISFNLPKRRNYLFSILWTLNMAYTMVFHSLDSIWLIQWSIQFSQTQTIWTYICYPRDSRPLE